MSTPLGPGGTHGSGFTLSVVNNEATTTLNSGRAAQLDISGTIPTYYADTIADERLAVLVAIAGGDEYVGAAKSQMVAGALGSVIVFGRAEVFTTANAIVAGNLLEAAAAGAYDRWVTPGTEAGIALEANASLAVFIGAFVNGLSLGGFSGT